MSAAPKTQVSLILRLRDPGDVSAWEEFVTIYRPVIVRLAVAHGLQHSDADDLAQQVLLSVARRVPGWEADPQRARFRTWLGRVVRNAALNALSRRKPDRAAGGTSALVLINGKAAEDCDDAEVLELEWRREAFRWIADQIRDEFQPKTWEAFWLTAVEGLSPDQAARQTGKSIGAVYVARSRVMTRFQEQVRTLSGDEPAEVIR
ncbi:sigma-70 family RNA polymerase sigma factor [bacterium]|nr:sigma-70 family RNA polymerase sigma factor [bacterium]